jgi:hypothetical protein
VHLVAFSNFKVFISQVSMPTISMTNTNFPSLISFFYSYHSRHTIHLTITVHFYIITANYTNFATNIYLVLAILKSIQLEILPPQGLYWYIGCLPSIIGYIFVPLKIDIPSSQTKFTNYISQQFLFSF